MGTEVKSSARTTWLLVGIVTLAMGGTAYGQMTFESEPIDYEHKSTNDPIARLQKEIDDGRVRLDFDEEHGYLPAVLESLKVPVSSQMLVFSQTSFQLRKISPRRPRAVYFNEDAYVGWVQFGDVVEISAVDPQQGAIFYTLEQEPVSKPRFVRDRGQCITCHASSRTQGVPGHLVRSVYADGGGVPILGSGTFTTSHSSPFSERWGGWYVSGTHGDQRHMGNVVVQNKSAPELLNREAGANVTQLSKILDVEPYLSPHSDIVALMVLEHQTQMHNALTRANFECRLAEYQDGVMNKALCRPLDYRSESTQRRIADASTNVLKYMLMTDEYRLEAPVRGTSAFANEFKNLGPRDIQGRSLRDLDLEKRLFKYPCSYLIYSTAFEGLPTAVKVQVYDGLRGILTGKDDRKEFAHLSPDDKTAILEILTDTTPDFVQK